MLLCVIVTESFDLYIAKETLEGDNKYDAGDHGMQVVHSDFPYTVLCVYIFLDMSTATRLYYCS